jgi:hypothetical protein
MNTNSLARQYDKLTPEERLPLIMAASTRGDELEGERLSRSAPRVCFTVPDYFGRSLAFREVAELHFMELLHLAGMFLGLLAGETEADKISERFRGATMLCGFLFKTKLAGWRLFCQEESVDPMLLWSVLPGFESLRWAEKWAATKAFQPDAAARFLASEFLGDSGRKQVTAESEARELRECLEARAAFWG